MTPSVLEVTGPHRRCPEHGQAHEASGDVEVDIADSGNDVEVPAESNGVGAESVEAGGVAVLDLACGFRRVGRR